MPGTIFQKGTLLIPTGGADHLHVVINDPVYCPFQGDNVVLLVNISSVYPGKYADTTCILLPGSHRFVRHDSWVVYREAVIKKVDALETGVAQNQIRTHDPFLTGEYLRIREGFDNSPDVKIKIARFLKQHRL